MIDPKRVLRPLQEAEPARERLDHYTEPGELSDALVTTWEAIQRSLRLLLRSDPAAPDEIRLGALSPAELPTDRLLETLRRRDLISLELAGRVHELEQAIRRAMTGDVRAADSDLALGVVDRLQSEVRDRAERPVLEAAHHTVETGLLEEPAQSVPPPRRRSWRPLVIVGAVVALLMVVLLAISLTDFWSRGLDDAITAFDQDRMEEAEAGFRQILEDNPDNVTALLYLGRIQRRQGNYQAAAEALRRAARQDPQDPDVRRELGNLFMQLDRPDAAADQYRRAMEIDPQSEVNWIGLIRALRAQGDPRAEELLRRAPPGVRAALQQAS